MRYLRLGTIFALIAALLVTGWTALEQMRVDRVAPRFHDAQEELHLSVKDDADALLQGLTASDNRDGDLTNKILVERTSRFVEGGQIEVSYVVFDKANNMARHTRTVIYDDYTSPVLQLNEPLMYNEGEEVAVMDKLKLYDCLSGDITHKVKLEQSNVDDSRVGLYEVTISAITDYGEEMKATLPVNIIQYNALAPVITLSEYLVYVKKGETVHPKDYITDIRDCNGFPIDVNVVFAFSQVDTSQVGGGQYRLEVIDGNGNKGYSFLSVIVTED